MALFKLIIKNSITEWLSFQIVLFSYNKNHKNNMDVKKQHIKTKKTLGFSKITSLYIVL